MSARVLIGCELSGVVRRAFTAGKTWTEVKAEEEAKAEVLRIFEQVVEEREVA